MHIVIDYMDKDSSMTLSQVLTAVYAYINAHPDEEVWLDGDAKAIVAEDRSARA